MEESNSRIGLGDIILDSVERTLEIRKIKDVKEMYTKYCCGRRVAEQHKCEKKTRRLFRAKRMNLAHFDDVLTDLQ